MKVRNIAVSVLALSLLAACSSSQLRVDYKSGVTQVPPLEIPPDLTASAVNEQYSIPGENGELVTRYSDYSKDSTSSTGRGGDCSAVLPELKNMHLENNGAQHWIVVADKAENIWPGIKAFWLEMGFKISLDNPQAGVMETDWLENHGNVPKSYVRHILGNGKAVDILKSEGIRDQYVTRIERSKDGLGTEIHISSQQMQAKLDRNQRNSTWIPHERDPEIELAVLQMLMDRLGNPPDTASPKAKLVSAASAVEVAPQVKLTDTVTGKSIQIDEPFDRSWRRVGLALDAAHLAVTDKDRSIGVYFVSSSKTKDRKNDKEQQTPYQVTVRESHGITEVSVVDQFGKSDTESAALLGVLYQALASSSAKSVSDTGDKNSSDDALRHSRKR